MVNTPDSEMAGLVHQKAWAATYCEGVATEALYRSCMAFAPEFRCDRVVPAGGIARDDDGNLVEAFAGPGWENDHTHDRRVMRALVRAARYQAKVAAKLGIKDPDPAAALHWVFVNGSPIGFAERPLDLATQLRELRVGSMLHRQASVALEPTRRSLHIMGEPGGARRLLLRTGALGFEECTRLAQNVLRNPGIPDTMRLGALLDAGVLEYVCPLEERNISVRPLAFKTPAE